MSEAEGFVELFRARQRAEPDRLFARFEGAPISLATLGRQADAFASALRRRGVAQGTRIAVMLRNSPAALAVAFGLARAGAIWVPINVQQRGEGLRYILDHCAPRLVVAEADLVGTIRESGARLDGVAVVAHGGGGEGRLETLLAGDADFTGPPPAPSDCFAICYTSGTTGPPKGVLLTHAMLRFAGEAAALVSAARDGDVLFLWEPLSHIGGMQLLVLPLIRRATLSMVARFSASRFWQQVVDTGATHIHYLGGILQILLKQPSGPLDRGHGVRLVWGGGCAAEVWRPFEERFGVEIRECYGMTEASSITTYNDTRTVGAVGRPVPWLAVELRDGAGRRIDKPGERGEILVRAHRPAALFSGYFRNPEATAKALRDGALHTGDLGTLDAEGNLAFLGRMTDSVRCRGENVSAWEVERVAGTHPAIEDCAMIGVAADIGEQDINLFVQPRNGERIDPAVLSAWLAQRLAPYQNPRYIAVVASFERTASQRIMKHKLSRSLDDAWDRLRAPSSKG
jgi:crotonobetaine/carnitine-CoA ligase